MAITMTDILRKAVELAGWLEEDDEGEYLQVPGWPISVYINKLNESAYQYLKDALAAQICRQVDALDGPLLCVENDKASVQGIGFEYRIFRGPDRTMNTLRAIMESKVLESD